MSAPEYRPRIVDNIIKSRLESSGALLIEGAKWCGKTTTGGNAARSALYMQDPDMYAANMAAVRVQPSVLLEGDVPRLLDEWQMAPVLWDAVRFAVDQRQEAGQFILTGSAVPADDAVMHSGTGRIARLRMRPMSLFESGESTGVISLKKIFAGQSIDEAVVSTLSIPQLAYATVRGGWPGALGKTEQSAVQTARDYVESLIHADVSRVDNVKRNPSRVEAILKSLARNISTMAKASSIEKDVTENGDVLSMARNTLREYLTALERLFVVENVPAWNPALRSRTAIRTAAKRHFVDPSIAAAVMNLSPEALLHDFLYFGFLFKSLCVRDLRIYSQPLDGRVYHYRDKNDLETDIVVVLGDGRWGAIEVKLGAREIDDAAANLLKLKNIINTDTMRGPSFLMVLTGTEYGYTRHDGVHVVPIGVLAP